MNPASESGMNPAPPGGMQESSESGMNRAPVVPTTNLSNFNKPEPPPEKNIKEESVNTNSILNTTSSQINPPIKQLINPSITTLREEKPKYREPLLPNNQTNTHVEELVAPVEKPVANVNQILINAQKVLNKATEFVQKQKNKEQSTNALQQGGSSSKHKMRNSKRILQKYRHKISVRNIRTSNKIRKYKSRIKKSKSLR